MRCCGPAVHACGVLDDMPTPVHEPSFLKEVWGLFAVGQSNDSIEKEEM